LTRELVALSIHINPYRIPKPKIQTSKNYVDIDTHENANKKQKYKGIGEQNYLNNLPPTSVIMATTYKSLVTNVVSPSSNLNE